MQITCHKCGEKFVCGVNDKKCWCFDLPKVKIKKIMLVYVKNVC